MDERKSIEVTPEMIRAGVEVLSGWKYDMEFVSERQAVEEIYRAMAAILATPLSQTKQDPNNH
jgi:cell envelope opacity-associated protein A